LGTNGLSTISKPRALSSDIARQWLVKFGEMCQRDITSALAQIWVEQLRDVAPELLERACDRVAKTWTSGFLPTPGNVRAQIDNANSAGLKLEAAKAWERWLAHVQKYFHADLGWDRRAPRLDAIMEHAGRAAGRAHWIESCPESELQWARKRFIESYTLAHETGQVQNLLTRGEAKKIITSLTAEKPTRQLPSPASLPAVPGPEENGETLRALDEVLS
jgi:hypothetical protein